MSVPAAMAIGRSRFASLSSEPAKPTLFQASIEKSDPPIAAPMTGHSVAPKPVAGQNAGPKLAAIAAALRPTGTPSTMRAASAVVLIAVSEVWMTAAVRTPRTLIHVNRITERIARIRCGDRPTWIGPLPKLTVVPRKTSGERLGKNTAVKRANATTRAVASSRESALTNSVCGCCAVAMPSLLKGWGLQGRGNLVTPAGRRYVFGEFKVSPAARTPVRLLPRDEEFFDLFVEVANRNKEAAHHLRELFAAEPERRTPHVEALKRLEHEADQITHEVVNRLDRTFITPLDREDIHQLASDLDDVMDAMDGTARRSQIFRLGPAPQGVKLLTEVIERMVAVLGEGVARLKKGDDVMRYCVEAKQLEEEGDAIYHESLGQLFERERDPLEIIKWKEIYDTLERTLDQSEDVANVLESITLKHA